MHGKNIKCIKLVVIKTFIHISARTVNSVYIRNQYIFSPRFLALCLHPVTVCGCTKVMF